MRSKRIQKQKADRKQKLANQQREKRREQKQLQRKRVSNMYRDMEKYALVNFVNNPKNVSFTLANIKDQKSNTIEVTDRKNISCTCMDWRIRGKNSKINCKHILYVVSQILQLEYAISKENIISNFKKFEQAFDRIKINFNPNGLQINHKFTVKKDREITDEDICPICFTQILSEGRENVLNCLKCYGLVHNDCMAVWMRNAINKSCVYCHDPGIAKNFAF